MKDKAQKEVVKKYKDTIWNLFQHEQKYTEFWTEMTKVVELIDPHEKKFKLISQEEVS